MPHLPLFRVEQLTEADRPQAASFLGMVMPGRPLDRGLDAHDQGGVLALHEGSRIVGLLGLDRQAMALDGAWHPVAVARFLALQPGLRHGPMTDVLLRHGEAWCRDQGMVVMIAEGDTLQPLVAAGFVPLAPPLTAWTRPEHLRHLAGMPSLRLATPHDLPRLAATYRARAVDLDGAQARDGAYWDRLAEHLAPHGQLHLYLCEGTGHEAPSGYVAFTAQGRGSALDVTVQEWIDLDRDAFWAIGGFLSRLQARASRLRLPLLPDRPMATLLADPGSWQVCGRIKAAMRTIVPGGPATPQAVPPARPGYRPSDLLARLQAWPADV